MAPRLHIAFATMPRTSSLLGATSALLLGFGCTGDHPSTSELDQLALGSGSGSSDVPPDAAPGPGSGSGSGVIDAGIPDPMPDACTTNALGFSNCAPAAECDTEPKEFSASITLMSPKHHVKTDQHIYNPPFGADVISTCKTGDCRGFFRHGRSATVKWQAYCVKDGGKCVARVKTVQDFLVNANNVGGAFYHWHGLEPEHSCAFIDSGAGPDMTSNCSIGGAEDVEPVPNMTQWGDGVVYGSGYAANHDNSNQPSIGISAGYGPAGVFVIINNSANATYTRAQAFSQGMMCDTDGKVYKLTDDGAGRSYPLSGGVKGNE